MGCVATAAFAQKSAQESFDDLEAKNRAIQSKAQLEVERSQLRWKELQAEEARRQAESERMLLEIARQRLRNETLEAARRTEQATEDQIAVAKKTKADAEEFRHATEQASVRATNTTYLFLLIVAVAIGIALLIRASNKGGPMKEEQKFGVITIIFSLLATLFVVMLSDNWALGYDFLQNLMTFLRIQLFQEEGKYPTSYLIDFPSKYAVFTFLGIAAYGLTTYLGITRAPRRNRETGTEGTDNR